MQDKPQDKPRCTLSLIVAMAENGVIGADNGIPWKCPTDMRYFREMTMGKPVVMGRKTWESLKKPLVGRDNIVITRDTDYRADGGEVVHSLAAALDLARDYAAEDGLEECEIMVIGGSTVYAELLDSADRIYLTLVHLKPDGDSYFFSLEDLQARGWSEVSKVDRDAGKGDDAGLTFYRLECNRS